jgi:hypothetical protein
MRIFNKHVYFARVSPLYLAIPRSSRDRDFLPRCRNSYNRYRYHNAIIGERAHVENATSNGGRRRLFSPRFRDTVTRIAWFAFRARMLKSSSILLPRESRRGSTRCTISTGHAHANGDLGLINLMRDTRTHTYEFMADSERSDPDSVSRQPV